MRLTAIKLAGFKSFVDPTHMPLTTDLVGIVGPNGCGKSNIIDAVRWVTGESSAKQLRGQSLEDVIFNGSTHRKPVGRASVELKFDTSDGKLQGQYANFNEVSVRRELTRDGASKYFINGVRSRRRDVIDLFLGTGLGGRNNYAIIGQGSINRLIEAQPEQMRQVLEEAAGISRYKQRRHETENRIRHTRENLERLQDVRHEVEQRLGVLEKQSADAARFKELKSQQRQLEAETLVLRWRKLNQGLQTTKARYEQLKETWGQADHAQRQAAAALEAVQAEQQQAANQCQDKQAEFYQQQGEATRLAQALAHARQLQQLRQQEQDDLNGQLKQLHEQQAHDQQALADAALQQTKRQNQYTNQQAACSDQQTAMQQAETAVSQLEQQWEQLNDQQSPVSQLSGEKNQHAYLQRRLQQLQLREQQLAEQLAAAAPSTNDAPLQTLAAQINQSRQQLEDNERDLSQLGQTIQGLQQSYDQALAHGREQSNELAAVKAKLTSEITLQKGVLQEDDAYITQWLNRQGLAAASGVARQISAPEQWQPALESALDDILAGFLVEQLPSQNQWPATTVRLVHKTPAAALASPNTKLGELPSLASEIEAPASILAAASAIFVAADWQQALKHQHLLQPGQRIVCLDGALLDAAGVQTPNAQNARQGVLQREQNIQSLTQQQQSIEQELATSQDQQQRLKQELKQARSERGELAKTVQKQQQALARLQAEQQAVEVKHQQQQQRRLELTEEQASLADELSQLQTQLSQSATQLELLEEQAATWTQQRDNLRENLQQARQRRNTQRQASQTAEQELQRLQQQNDQAQQQYNRLQAQLEHADAERKRLQQRLAGLANQQLEQADIAESEQQHLQAVANQDTAKQALKASRQALEAVERRVQEQHRAVFNAEQQLANARDDLQTTQIQFETTTARCQDLVEQMDSNTAQQLPTLAIALGTAASITKWQEKLAKIKSKINKLGAINLAAIEEYNAAAERKNYLDEQHNDLIQALETLEKAIAKIDRETRARFKETFEQVNARFGKMFPILFAGGKAELALTEDNLLTTGVSVMARPPGKRNASIQMLSGGEKTLTAAALLFALFELNPAPFCMLDEIDAPLDDANVQRFCKLVKQMSRDVQFIIITHNKLTMELAEQLHGVTMMEPGASRLVSVNIDQALDMAG